MIAFLKPYFALFIAFIVIAIALVLFFSGVHLGGKLTQEKWDAQKAADAKALATAQAQSLEEVRRYELQLESANGERDQAFARLARVRAGSRADILCYPAESDRRSLPGLPAPPSGGTAGGGQLPQAIGFDPSDQLYIEADRADEIVEQYRDFYNRWPQ